MSGQIFISYRHDDAAHPADDLHNYLSARFPRNKVYLDDDRVSPGIDYTAVIESNVGPCDAVIAVIGPRWLGSADAEGRARLDDPHDFVRLQIGLALERGVPVIPVLVGGASMPQPGELPEDLTSLLDRQPFTIGRERFRADAEPLIGALEQTLERTQAEPRRKREDQRRAAGTEWRDHETQERLETERREPDEEEESRPPATEAHAVAERTPELPPVAAQNANPLPEDTNTESVLRPSVEEGPEKGDTVSEGPAAANGVVDAGLAEKQAAHPAGVVIAGQTPSKKVGATRRSVGRPLVVLGSVVAAVLLIVVLLLHARRASQPPSVSIARLPPRAPSSLPGPTPSISQTLPNPTTSVADWLAEAERNLNPKDYAQVPQRDQKTADADSASAKQRPSNVNPPPADRSPVNQPSPRITPSSPEGFAEAKRYLDAKDYATALPLLQKAADAGNPEAVDRLGGLYYYGHGVTQDYGQARQWYLKAAAAGNSDAMYQLGELYQYGQGVARDYTRARYWYQKAVDAGDSQGMNGLGRLYENGRGVVRDYTQARQWYQKAVDAGNAQGLVNLGSMYEGSFGVAQDYTQARQRYQKAVDAGNSNAMYHLGLLYQYGLGVPQDYAQARQWYQKTVEAGNAQGMVNLGSLYEEGLGVAQDYAEARQWYKKAADAGHPGGMNGLGRLYENGRGVPQDYAQARQWYQKAVEAGSVAAMEHLGSMYYYGHGVAQDYVKARQWYQKAVDGGWPVSLLPKN